MSADRQHTRLGALPSDWSVVPLGAVLTRVGDPVAVSPNRQYREIGIRSHGKGIFHKEPVTGESLGNKRVFSVVPESLVFNIVFAWEGAVAVTSNNEAGMIGSHRFPMFRPCEPKSVDVEFLRRFFQTKLGVQLLGDASPGGAGRNRTLSQKGLAEIPLPLPPLSEQRKIAAILSSLDDVIEGTQAVIDQLQVVKKAMMADLLTRGIPGRHKTFKQTEIGKIPYEWNSAPLGDLLEAIDAGWSPLCEPNPAGPEDWGVLKVSAASWGQFRPEENKKLPPALAPRPELEVKPGDLIVSRANTPELVGRSVLVRETRPRLLLCDKLLRLRLRPGMADSAYLNIVLGAPKSRVQIEDGATGSSRSMRNISQGKLRAIEVPVPPIAEQQEIGILVESCLERVTAESGVLAGLAQLKSALMSVLLTGEVRVKVDEEAAA